MNYNAVISVHDISDDSGAVVEPVSLSEFKNYLRTEGFMDGSSIIPSNPITVTLAQGATTVQDNRLISAVILMLARSGTVYGQDTVAGNKTFSFNSATGTITFQQVGGSGGEPIDITYGASNGSGVFNFTGDDALMNDLLVGSRQLIEQIGGISIVPHTWEAVITNLCGMIEIPRGPNAVIWSLKDCYGNAITDYTVIGNFWKYLKSPCYPEMTLIYQAGYVFLPKPIKTDILRLATYMYENRGEDPKIEGFAFQLTSKYSRNLIA